jgi:hypothetical protein
MLYAVMQMGDMGGERYLTAEDAQDAADELNRESDEECGSEVVGDGAASVAEMDDGEIIRHGTFGPIVWDSSDDSTRAAGQDDMDSLPVGPDLTAEEEAAIEETE